MSTICGLDQLADNQDQVKGKIAYLCHNSSITKDYQPGYLTLKQIFADRFSKVFSPQHGLFGDVQANMIESSSFCHQELELEVHSLYSETREPTDEMLDKVDTIIVDLQDVGTRIYTYIHTLTLLLRKVSGSDTKVIVLDRPNPLGGEVIEGNVLDLNFSSFVGLTAIPVRHALTIGELGKFVIETENLEIDYQVIEMKNWKREMLWPETGLAWISPSPNMPDFLSAITFPGLVLLEGTNISEGRGTCTPFQVIGHPDIYALSFTDHLSQVLEQESLAGQTLRPVSFQPTFDKHTGKTCDGFQIHVHDFKEFKPWAFGQVLLRELIHNADMLFKWLEPPYEYEYEKLPIDILNGNDQLRNWAEEYGDIEKLAQLEAANLEKFKEIKQRIQIYS